MMTKRNNELLLMSVDQVHAKLLFLLTFESQS